MTALEYARLYDQPDLMRLFERRENLLDHISISSADPMASYPIGRNTRVLAPVNALIIMDYVSEMNELEDLAEVDDMDTPEALDINDSQDSTRSSPA